MTTLEINRRFPLVSKSFPISVRAARHTEGARAHVASGIWPVISPGPCLNEENRPRQPGQLPATTILVPPAGRHDPPYSKTNSKGKDRAKIRLQTEPAD